MVIADLYTTSSKFKTKKLSIILSFYFYKVLEQLQNNTYTNFPFEQALCFVMYSTLEFLSFLRDAASRWWPTDLSGSLKNDLFCGICLSKQSFYQERYFFNVYAVLGRGIHASIAKLSDRCFCWFPAAMLVPIRMDPNMAFPQRSSINLGKQFIGMFRI